MIKIPNRPLSKNFSLHELIHSGRAEEKGWAEQFNPPVEVITNLEFLVNNILQPLRDSIGFPISVESGYRCLKVNEAVGGAKKSDHLLGKASDIECVAIGNETLFRRIIELRLPFDQLINEFGFSWIHVSHSERNRREILEAYLDNGQKKYRPFKI